jgi:ankyrin repeat protein
MASFDAIFEPNLSSVVAGKVPAPEKQLSESTTVLLRDDNNDSSSDWSNPESSSSDDDSDDDDSSVSFDDDQLNGYLLTVGDLRQIRASNSETNLMKYADPKPIVNLAPKQVPRRNSETGESKGIVYCVQTTSPMESKITTASQMKPRKVLEELLTAGGHSTTVMSHDLCNWVPCDVKGYSLDLMEAVRKNDLDYIKKLHQTGRNLQCANRFGESILHAICRHGRTEMLQFLTTECGVYLQVACDGGRSPLHDACWTAQPNFECIAHVLSILPQLLLVSDKRGFTPLDYAPRDCHEDWETFLRTHTHLLPTN